MHARHVTVNLLAVPKHPISAGLQSVPFLGTRGGFLRNHASPRRINSEEPSCAKTLIAVLIGISKVEVCRDASESCRVKWPEMSSSSDRMADETVQSSGFEHRYAIRFALRTSRVSTSLFAAAANPQFTPRGDGSCSTTRRVLKCRRHRSTLAASIRLLAAFAPAGSFPVLDAGGNGRTSERTSARADWHAAGRRSRSDPGIPGEESESPARRMRLIRRTDSGPLHGTSDDFRNATKATVNLVSLSQIRNRDGSPGWASGTSSDIRKLRACWLTHAASG